MFKKFFTSISSGIFAQSINLTSSLYISRFYPNTDIAQYSIIVSLAAALIIFAEIGTNQITTARAGKSNLKDVIKIRTLSTFITSIFAAFTWELITSYYPLPKDSGILFATYIATSSAANFQAYRFQGKQELNKFLLFFHGRSTLQFTILLVIMITINGTNPSIAFIAAGIISNISFLITRKQNATKENINVIYKKSETIRTCSLYTLTAICVTAIMRADAFILPHFSLEWTAEYFKAKNIALGISILTTGIAHVYLSHTKNFIKDGIIRFIKKLFVYSTPFILLSGLITLFSQTILNIAYQEINQTTNTTFTLLILAYTTGFITNPLGAILVKAELAKSLFILNLIQCTLIYSFGTYLSQYGPPYFALSILIINLVALVYTLTTVLVYQPMIYEKINSHA